ncbi:MAG: ribosome silencing factor [Clostridiales bacterium]|nr:ribosome silencing factor [Clostridiales bacterium]
MENIEIVKTAVKAIDSKNGENIEVIDIEDLTVLAEYFVIVTASSTTQLKSIAQEVEYKLSLAGCEPHHIDGRNTPWICLDYNSVVVHIFYKDQRDFYSLERLWEDGKKLDTASFISDGDK